jgi:hypothetical protein
MLPSRPGRRLLLLMTVVLALGGVALAMSVQAERDATPVIRPYDPLPRW